MENITLKIGSFNDKKLKKINQSKLSAAKGISKEISENLLISKATL